MTKTVKISEATHKRLEALGSKSETFDEIIQRLLDESDYLPKFKKLTKQLEADVEHGKQSGNMPVTVADEIIRALNEFIETVEAR